MYVWCSGMPISFIASNAVEMTSPAGSVPAERALTSPWVRFSSRAAAICERPALPWQTNSTRGWRDSMLPWLIALARRREAACCTEVVGSISGWRLVAASSA